MQQAAFSIVNYQFDKVNIDLEYQKTNELNLAFETKGVFIKNTKNFELIFIVQVENDNEPNPFIKIRCKGLFKFENINLFEEIPDFFYRNAIAILFPYVRAYLSLVTTQANVPGIILPTMNLSNLEGELRKNTIQE
ncbi:MAG: protein-export chaperone SecB [Chitinophagales bacterium]|nr:protein-export chaperone SecB [Bacteroidota bacterium]MCB9043822.1 protein-export chaperone SecB [Chitinophagales bacterium]